MENQGCGQSRANQLKPGTVLEGETPPQACGDTLFPRNLLGHLQPSRRRPFRARPDPLLPRAVLSLCLACVPTVCLLITLFTWRGCSQHPPTLAPEPGIFPKHLPQMGVRPLAQDRRKPLEKTEAEHPGRKQYNSGGTVWQGSGKASQGGS